ncbi:hypothetical protein POVCU2_0016120 [Plasmodium ovale curtisi]|uniref:Uncharacterized protein n=1 Tax=Plasmodium ovale curtisi TaxID=864141 RepID=A0A1A8VPZ0_PLAOA|nr:hypothetical protein POVCU2_0016120 [Plasmodium ovale curtisi]SBS87295.1 hypothetical protein POVCU1_014340 [Plasmodium ovale curtisi]
MGDYWEMAKYGRRNMGDMHIYLRQYVGLLRTSSFALKNNCLIGTHALSNTFLQHFLQPLWLLPSVHAEGKCTNSEKSEMGKRKRKRKWKTKYVGWKMKDGEKSKQTNERIRKGLNFSWHFSLTNLTDHLLISCVTNADLQILFCQVYLTNSTYFCELYCTFQYPNFAHWVN